VNVGGRNVGGSGNATRDRGERRRNEDEGRNEASRAKGRKKERETPLLCFAFLFQASRAATYTGSVATLRT
jgi:hypothetical protein